MIRGSDGLDYEDLAAPYSQAFKDAFREIFDRHEAQGCSTLECHRAAFAQACTTAGSTNKFGTRAHAYP